MSIILEGFDEVQVGFFALAERIAFGSVAFVCSIA